MNRIGRYGSGSLQPSFDAVVHERSDAGGPTKATRHLELWIVIVPFNDIAINLRSIFEFLELEPGATRRLTQRCVSVRNDLKPNVTVNVESALVLRNENWFNVAAAHVLHKLCITLMQDRRRLSIAAFCLYVRSLLVESHKHE